MSEFDAKSLAAFLVSSKLITLSQLQEAQGEVRRTDDPEELLGVFERKGLLTALQLDKLRKGDRHGYFLGNYRVLYKIDSGSFARVYRADDPASGRVVAIKVLRNRFMEDAEKIEWFEREGRVGMTLRHPNIVELISMGKDTASGQYFLIMEFVEGGNLRDILGIRGRFSVADGLKMLEDIASALAYAFSRGLTHRDLKLTNVLISSAGVAKVVDFGLAQFFSNKFNVDDEAQVARTVDYAGLEKATDAPFGDVRSDIYFLGCIAYELLSGRPPLQPTKNKLERMQRDRFMRVKPLKLTDLESPYPQVLRLIETMMEVEPTKRYQTPAQLLDAIKQVRLETGTMTNKDGSIRKAAATVFIVESDERLQDALREKLKSLGYRVLISGDPSKAVDRFSQQPFQIMLVDAETTRKDGLEALHQVLQKSRKVNCDCRGIVIASDGDQEGLGSLKWDKQVTVLQRPLKMGQLISKLREIAPPPA